MNDANDTRLEVFDSGLGKVSYYFAKGHIFVTAVEFEGGAKGFLQAWRGVEKHFEITYPNAPITVYANPEMAARFFIDKKDWELNFLAFNYKGKVSDGN